MRCALLSKYAGARGKVNLLFWVTSSLQQDEHLLQQTSNHVGIARPHCMKDCILTACYMRKVLQA